jgi:hypothetical protein
MSNWITIGQLDAAVIDWAQKFEDRVVERVLYGEWASERAKDEVHGLFGELRDNACEGDSKAVKAIALRIFAIYDREVARHREASSEREAQDLLRKALGGEASPC